MSEETIFACSSTLKRDSQNFDHYSPKKNRGLTIFIEPDFAPGHNIQPKYASISPITKTFGEARVSKAVHDLVMSKYGNKLSQSREKSLSRKNKHRYYTGSTSSGVSSAPESTYNEEKDEETFVEKRENGRNCSRVSFCCTLAANRMW